MLMGQPDAFFEGGLWVQESYSQASIGGKHGFIQGTLILQGAFASLAGYTQVTPGHIQATPKVHSRDFIV
jgi:hypothetical protein